MIPEDIRRFALTSIPSVPYLEAVLLIRRDRDVTWSAAALAKSLYVAEALAVNLVDAMIGAGVAVATGPGERLFRYAQDTALDDLLGRLAELYRTDMIEITRLIHDARQRSAHHFADAFSIRRDG